MGMEMGMGMCEMELATWGCAKRVYRIPGFCDVSWDAIRGVSYAGSWDAIQDASNYAANTRYEVSGYGTS